MMATAKVTTGTSFFTERSEQSKIKSEIIKSYFTSWARVMKGTVKRFPQHNPQQIISYIDLFAGPGKYADNSNSTPLLVLEQAIKDADLRQMLFTSFNDRAPEHIHSLRAAVSALPGVASLKHQPQFHNFEVGDNLVAHLEKISLVPTLAFVDPFGYKGLSSRLVNAFVERNFGTDCIFFFNYNRISMGVSNDMVRDHMAALFGDDRVDEIRSRVKGLEPYDREMVIVEELSLTLKNGGARRYVVPFAFKDDKGSRTSHHLILVSKHPLANRLIKEIMRDNANMRRDGIAGFTYNPARAGQGFMAGFDPNVQTLDRLVAELPQRFHSRTLTVEAVYETDNIDRPYALSDYKEALKRLEKAGRVRTDPPMAARRKIRGEVTMADHVQISFP